MLASTVDEAVGAAIDATARAVRVRWKGRAPGAALEALAQEGLPGVVGEDEVLDITKSIQKPKKVLPGEMRFSFAGLHSWVDRYVLEHGRKEVENTNELQLEIPAQTRLHKTLRLPGPHRVALARAFQEAAFAQLDEKIVLGLEWCAANRELLSQDIPPSLQSDSCTGLGLSPPVKHVVVSGGVASNMLFRERRVLHDCGSTYSYVFLRCQVGQTLEGVFP